MLVVDTTAMAQKRVEKEWEFKSKFSKQTEIPFSLYLSQQITLAHSSISIITSLPTSSKT
jgi:hypothetical protein